MEDLIKNDIKATFIGEEIEIATASVDDDEIFEKELKSANKRRRKNRNNKEGSKEAS